MTGRESSAEIEQQAVQWAARLDAGALAPDDCALFDQWVSADPRRMGAYAMACATLARVALAHEDRRMEQQPVASGLSRRQMLWMGGSAAAAAVVGSVGLALFGNRSGYETARGEMLRIALPDGSVVNLNTASHIDVHFTETSRTILLRRGEALFDVAKDAARPFVVMAGDARVRAVGTAFTVRHDAAAPVDVTVSEGVVEVSDAAEAQPPVRLAEGMRARVDGAIDAAPISSEAIAQSLSWRDGKIAFRDTSLAEAAAEFARYNAERIVIPDPDVAQQTITGLFLATDPQGFARAVAESLGLRAQVEGDRIILDVT
jgi:transmembrane sensor